MSELSRVDVRDRIVELIDQLVTFLCNASVDDAPVRERTATSYESALLQPVEQASYIGVPGDEPVADLAAGQTVFRCTTQNSQNIVLRYRQIEWLQNFRDALSKCAGGSHHIENNFLLQAFKGLFLLDFFLKRSAHEPAAFEEVQKYNDYRCYGEFAFLINDF